MGGTLARYAAEGAAVYLLVATQSSPDRAEVREAEIACAAKALGLAGYSFLGYRESGMTWSPGGPPGDHLVTADSRDVAALIAAEMRRLRPQVVLTFDATGAYGHPDHVAIGRAAALAFDLVRGDEAGPQKLYAAVFGRRLLAWGVRALRLAGRDPHHFGSHRDVDLVAALRTAPRPTTFIEVKPYLGVRRQAVLCHRSQLGGAPWALRRFELLPPRLRGAVFPREVYARLWPPPRPHERETDLFEGAGTEKTR
ncbi:MAG: PIG-L family deacetylase [Chloroflexi bacterium]|nr:PIG-L family deacetylase [Chloroflexota bacterium]